MYSRFFKRFLDLAFSIVLIILLFPLILTIVIGLGFYNKGTPFFTQLRPGKNEKVFKLIKFKTMRDAFDNIGNPLPDKERITPLGFWVRKLSIDELPQLFNVFKGDMSLIGPRPLLVKYLTLYNERQKRRHLVRPGITGWAQINGRNSISWNEKFELDNYYVEHISFLFDIKILLLTFVKLFKTKQVNASDGTTMRPFEGNN